MTESNTPAERLAQMFDDAERQELEIRSEPDRMIVAAHDVNAEAHFISERDYAAILSTRRGVEQQVSSIELYDFDTEDVYDVPVPDASSILLEGVDLEMAG